MIREAQRRDVAAQLLAGFQANPSNEGSWKQVAECSVEGADALLAALREPREEAEK